MDSDKKLGSRVNSRLSHASIGPLNHAASLSQMQMQQQMHNSRARITV